MAGGFGFHGTPSPASFRWPCLRPSLASPKPGALDRSIEDGVATGILGPSSQTMRSRIIPALLCAFWTQLLTAEAPRARLPIINGSAQPVDVFWLKSDTGRVPDGSVAPGEDTDITTTIGHWFALVGRSDGSGSIVDLMLAKRPEVREAMIRRGARLWILWWNDFTTDPPEFARLAQGRQPGLAAICREVFGDTVLRYTQPQSRLKGHLEGYDPSTAPTFAWPERLVKAKDEIRRQAAARDAAANAAPDQAK